MLCTSRGSPPYGGIQSDRMSLPRAFCTGSFAQVLELYTRDFLADHHSAQLRSPTVRAVLDFVVAVTRE
jgi:hypothetical protein